MCSCTPGGSGRGVERPIARRTFHCENSARCSYCTVLSTLFVKLKTRSVSRGPFSLSRVVSCLTPRIYKLCELPPPTLVSAVTYCDCGRVHICGETAQKPRENRVTLRAIEPCLSGFGVNVVFDVSGRCGRSSRARRRRCGWHLPARWLLAATDAKFNLAVGADQVASQACLARRLA